MLQHKKIHKALCERYNLIINKIPLNPKNYTSFFLNEEDVKHNEPAFEIELIPKSKNYYYKTVYVMKIKNSPLMNHIFNDLVSLYDNEKPKDLIIDFNTSK